MITYLIPFFSAFFISISIIPCIIKISHRYGYVAAPKEDRWHKKPTALLGGVGIYISFIIPALIFVPLNALTVGVLLCATAIFSLGLYDDLREVKPYTKLIFQIIVTIMVILVGVKVKIIPFIYIAIPLTVFWIVGITNALNILDNMDGLSTGIAFVASTCIFIYSIQNNLHLVTLFSSILSGTTLGFLIFNFNPAKIFMGDCGSLFLGFLLSIVTILGTWQEATNLLFVLLVPLFILVIPIFDMTLVTFYRKTYGRSISQGGKDHSSHRLVFLGLSERKAVLILMGISLFFGVLIIFLSRLDFFTTLILFSVLFVCLLFFGIFLGGIRVYAEKTKKTIYQKSIANTVILYKKQILQILIDIVVINVAYVSAYLLRYEGFLSDRNLELIETSLPILILVKISLFSMFGLYKGEWRYIGINDMLQVFKSASIGSLLCMAAMFVLFRTDEYSRSVFLIDYVLTLLMIGGTRVFIRAFREYFSTVSDESEKLPILIVGAGDGGELLLREIKNNPKLNYKPMGFIDDDIKKSKRVIHGLKVLGTRDDMPTIITKKGIKEVFVSILAADDDEINGIIEICKDSNVECKRMKPIIDNYK
jgi:UDP-GlcNAc:undecaprenyl-phosphate/decaprenyl-phosphate GlcNAc-1-phosphate transferase